MICLDKRFCLFVSGHTFKYIWVFAFIYLFIASWPRFCVGVIDPNWCRDEGYIWCLFRAFIVVLTKRCRMAGSSAFFCVVIWGCDSQEWPVSPLTHRPISGSSVLSFSWCASRPGAATRAVGSCALTDPHPTSALWFAKTQQPVLRTFHSS